MRSLSAGRVGLSLMFALSMAACAPKPPSCAEPIAPPAIDGSSALEAQMKAAHDAVIRFQKQSDSYQNCLVKAINAHHESPPFFSRFYDDGFERDLEGRKHQNQLAKEQVVGDFNTSVRYFNSIHP